MPIGHSSELRYQHQHQRSSISSDVEVLVPQGYQYKFLSFNISNRFPLFYCPQGWQLLPGVAPILLWSVHCISQLVNFIYEILSFFFLLPLHEGVPCLRIAYWTITSPRTVVPQRRERNKGFSIIVPASYLQIISTPWHKEEESKKSLLFSLN